MERVASNGQGYGRGGGQDGKWKRDKREKKLREIQTNERKNPEDMNKKRKQAGEKDRENVSERNGRMSNEKAWKTRKRARVPEGQSGENRREDCPKDCRKVSQEIVKKIAKKTGGKECRKDCPGK